MVLDDSYYFTLKKEIKPQLYGFQKSHCFNYFTLKKEIKPQQDTKKVLRT